MSEPTIVVDHAAQHRTLVRLMWLSVAAAAFTIALKVSAAAITGSVGFLSDALESMVNLVAALIGLWAIRLAAQPPDLSHHFGHGKAEYLSAAVEGALILLAALAIIWTSIERLRDPVPLDQPGIGLVLSALATLANLVVGTVMVRAGRRARSIAVEADGRHLLTDVVTSLGVLVGISLVAIFDWYVIDPIVAIAVGVNIMFTGHGLIRRSVTGMLDASISTEERQQVQAVLDDFRRREPVDFHALRSRESGRQRFIYVHLLTPDDWTVKRGHDLANDLSRAIERALPGAHTFVHIEPIDDPSSYDHDHMPPAEP
ncbi:MAG: cation transporter [Actinobacteria bacterium]|nr:cation transporter [Actinomycetota bacterium]